ncbi:hypothetical protein ACFLXD_02805 [Chloroflexota bacterium]
MPGKPHQGKGKRQTQSKKSRAMQRSATAGSRQQAIAQVPAVAVPSGRVPKEKSSAVRYPYITTELRRIGILTGIMLAILIVLALLLPSIS